MIYLFKKKHLLCTQKLHLFDRKYIKNIQIVKNITI